MCFGNYKTDKISEINDKDLKDLIDKCIKNTISWNDYFNHKFFTNNYPDYNETDNDELNVFKEIIECGKKFIEYRDHMRTYLTPISQVRGDNRKKKLEEQYEQWKTYIQKIKELSNTFNEAKKSINIPKIK